MRCAFNHDYAPPTKASKSRPGRDLTDTLFTDIRYSLTFEVRGRRSAKRGGNQTAQLFGSLSTEVLERD